MSYFQDASPESLGISSEGILRFLDRMEEKNIELHSFMVVRHGKCAAKGWWKPYAPELAHPLYSFGKTLTATAIGFARQEKILSLEERLVDLFPELLPKEPSENLQKVTLWHLLTMSCGHETEIDMESPDWIREFLQHPFLHEPGTFYKYNTAGTNMLAAVLKRKTGCDVTEFLKPRLLEPLGITSLTCSKCPGPEAVEMAGGGMRMTTEDMARFIYFVLNRGRWEGRQLLEEEWFNLACTKQIETAGDAEGHVKEWAYGYGFQCWMCRTPGSFRADGAFGQFGVVLPDKDLFVILTTGTYQTQDELDGIFEEIVPTLTDSAQEASAAADVLKERTGQMTIKAGALSEKIHHIAIIGSDYERSRHFYVDLLGFTVIRENHRKDKADCKIDLKCGEQEIELFIKPDAPKRPSYPEAQGLRHLAFFVESVEDTVVRLNSLGIVTEPIRTDEFTGKPMTFFADPDGLPLEIHE